MQFSGKGRRPGAGLLADSLVPGLAVTPTPRPTDGVDVYFGMPGEISEHEGFLRAKMDLEERRMRQINEVMVLGAPGSPMTQSSLNTRKFLRDTLRLPLKSPKVPLTPQSSTPPLR